ncbi:MAG TPA: 3-hydroxyacyl-CoA dehydrogenase NAD-binding domain-containing protein [Spirochaetia bacterium]|nr:3-hydroxyacyl-CoA dehydrogenase NAD-binding domain-containing protein [Spirochaetia bacterium]
MSERFRVTVVGAGLMGPGIAACAAAAGHPVCLVDVDPETASRGVEKARLLIRQLADNRLIDRDRAEAASNLLRAGPDLPTACAGASLVIEAAPEKLLLKQQIFRRLDELMPSNAILTSNTSGLRITDIASAALHKERIAGTHFWYPGHLVPLVEIVMSDHTAGNVATTLQDLLRSWGKAPVIVRKDLPGQLANRIFQAVIREALNIVQMGLATPEDVDTAIKMGMGLRFPVWGPLEHIDAVGLDLALSVQRDVLPSLNNEPYPPRLLQQLVSEAALGCKAGHGIYDWGKKDLGALMDKRDGFIIQALHYLRTAPNPPSVS